MTIKLTPEVTRRSKGTGATAKAVVSPKNQKKWLPANFRLAIDGVPAGSKRVRKVEALVIKQKTVENAVGDSRDYEREPAHLEVPNLVVSLPEQYAEEFYDWHEDFVILGHNGQDQERSATLEYLASDMKTVLFKLEFKNLGIFKIASAASQVQNSDTVPDVVVSMYSEEMSLGK